MLKPQPPPKSSALSILVVGAFLFVVIAGSIGLIWYSLGDLRENSVTISKAPLYVKDTLIEKAGAEHSVNRLRTEQTEPKVSALSAVKEPSAAKEMAAFRTPQSKAAKSVDKSEILQSMKSGDTQMHEIPRLDRNRIRLQADRLYAQGREFARIGDYNRAVDYITRSHHLMADDMHKGNLYTGDQGGLAARFSALGYCFYKMNNLVPAEQELTWAIDTTPQNPWLYKEREMIYRKMGKVQLAENDAATARGVITTTPTAKPQDTFESMFGTGGPEELGAEKKRH